MGAQRLLLTHVRRALWLGSHHPAYIPLVGLLAFAAAMSMSVPFTAILAPAVMLRPRRWTAIWLAAVLGSALGASLLTETFHGLGWAKIYAAYPEFASSDSWRMIVDWVGRYGLVALAAVVALPLPQTPALIVCAVSDLPLASIFVAVAGGKALKYGLVAWAVATFPEHFLRYLHRND